jgi:hypothetical protein
MVRIDHSDLNLRQSTFITASGSIIKDAAGAGQT